MEQMQYVKGEATRPVGEGNRIVCHVCNDAGAWGAGFAQVLAKRWPTAERAYKAWHKHRGRNDFAMGAVLMLQVEVDVWVASMVAQKGVAPKDGRAAIRYEALEAALARVGQEAMRLKASVHLPRGVAMGAGGTWEEVEPILQKTLGAAGVAVVVYDLAIGS